MKVALLSNVTIDMLAQKLKDHFDVYLSDGYDVWQQDIRSLSSSLYKFGPDAVVILLYAGAYEWDNPNNGNEIIDEWCDTISVLTNNLHNIPVYVSALDIPYGINCITEYGNDCYFEYRFLERIKKMQNNGVKTYVLPIKDAITNVGRVRFYSSKMWYMGHMPFSLSGLTSVADIIIRNVNVVYGMRKKCLVVDLDNTLWGGVIGEEGVEGISLSFHNEGGRFYDAQRILKKMKDKGVMLAIISKNNSDDVEPVFTHPAMVLHHEDFVSEYVNWDSKTENIKKMAQELNIGLDSFVFLDDNPAERVLMQAECPEVTVLDFPEDSSGLPEMLKNVYYKFFLTKEVTDEDVRKTDMYRLEKLRRTEILSGDSAEDYLKKLEMKMTLHLMKIEEIKRVTQLINKTNQFNVTTKRYTERDIITFSEADDIDIISVHMSDKYGEQGLVAVIILTYKGAEADIDTFLMSCRVMGRLAETEMMSRIKGVLLHKGIEIIYATYIKTKKNQPVTDLFDRLGFKEIERTDEKKRYIIETGDLPEPTGVFEVNEDWT